jgi:hypothetical protein
VAGVRPLDQDPVAVAAAGIEVGHGFRPPTILGG